MQTHHLYATCASSLTMAARLSWCRVDANIVRHFVLRIQDSLLPKIRLKFPSMISRSLCTPSCAAHRPSFAASLTWSSMRATEGDTITVIALPDFGLSFSLTIGKSWSFKLFPKPVWSRATTSPPFKIWTKHSSCSGFSWQMPGIFSTTEQIESRVSMSTVVLDFPNLN